MGTRLTFRSVPTRLKGPLWSGDGLGTPDIVLGHVGRKDPLGRTAKGVKLVGQIALGDATGDALNVLLEFHFAIKQLHD
jgi:hypothetical protein